MGITGAYLTSNRKDESYQEVKDRLKHYNEFSIPVKKAELETQAARCMECGVPFCHSACPLGNVIPDFNDAIAHEDWERAAEYLLETNPFPEFTGRVCPAPCEESCVLAINKPAVSIKQIEKRIIAYAWEHSLLSSQTAPASGNKVAVIGSGPAGLAAADRLVGMGHKVHVFEQDAKPGGLLRYGIPDFKLDKEIIDRRTALMEKKGVEFKTGIKAGKDISVDDLDKEFDAVLFAIGTQLPRDLEIEGRELKGVHYAMDYLSDSNRFVSGESKELEINARGKKVLVIGGGDTGSDCLGTALRQGAEKVTLIDIIPEPPLERLATNPWPEYPNLLRESTSHKEGGKRKWAVQACKFIGENMLTAVELQDVKWQETEGKWSFKPVEGSSRTEEYDLVFLAMGFVSPVVEGLLKDSGLQLSGKNNIKAGTADYKTSREKFFAAGDARRGQSLVVWAIQEGRDAAMAIHNFLEPKRG